MNDDQRAGTDDPLVPHDEAAAASTGGSGRLPFVIVEIMRRLGAALAGAVAGGAVGAMQYAIAQKGSRVSEQTSGIAGIGVSFRYGALGILLTIAATLLITALTRRPLWFLGSVVVLVLDAVAVLQSVQMVEHTGLHGNDKYLCLVIATGTVGILSGALWIRRRTPTA